MIFSKEFNLRGAETRIMAPMPGPPRKCNKAPKRATPYIAALYATPLLTPEQEFHLFRQMNYLKFKGDAAGAAGVRERIAKANMRLVAKLAGRFAHNESGYTFFDAISDGNLALMECVDRFDFTRGFKFSTYAAVAIKWEHGKSFKKRCRYESHYKQMEDEDSFQSIASHHDLDAGLAHQENVDLAKRCMSKLTSDREKTVVYARFVENQTLDSLGKELGISRERVRQISVRALEKMAA